MLLLLLLQNQSLQKFPKNIRLKKLSEHLVSLWTTLWSKMSILASVTRSGDFLDFGQRFKAFGNNKFVQISHILRQFW